MLRTLWITALVGSVLGLIVLVVALFGFSDNSMHLAALSAVSPGLATVPTAWHGPSRVGRSEQAPSRKPSYRTPNEHPARPHDYRSGHPGEAL